MRKIRLKNDVTIQGYKTIPAGTTFKVTKYNKRFVYVEIGRSTSIKFSRSEVEKLY